MSLPITVRRAAAVAAAALSALVAGLCAAPPASAQCSGSHCLPSGGYDYNTFWNCGAFYGGSSTLGGRCYKPGVLGFANAHTHNFGFGSADYDGNGDGVGVLVEAVPHSSGYGWGAYALSLARACYASNCYDQDHTWYYLGVTHDHFHRHTIYGHGKA